MKTRPFEAIFSGVSHDPNYPYRDGYVAVLAKDSDGYEYPVAILDPETKDLFAEWVPDPSRYIYIPYGPKEFDEALIQLFEETFQTGLDMSSDYATLVMAQVHGHNLRELVNKLRNNEEEEEN